MSPLFDGIGCACPPSVRLNTLVHSRPPVCPAGTHAFASDGEADESFDKILECSPPYDKVEMTVEAEDFVRKLLMVDTDVRMTAKQALEHPWIKPHLKPSKWLQ